MYVMTFCVTFLSVSHHIRMYVHFENRSSIQSLVLMCSANLLEVLHCWGPTRAKQPDGIILRHPCPIEFSCIYHSVCINHSYICTYTQMHAHVHIHMYWRYACVYLYLTLTYICTYSVTDSDL